MIKHRNQVYLIQLRRQRKLQLLAIFWMSTNQMQKIQSYQIKTLHLQRMISKQLLTPDTIQIGWMHGVQKREPTNKKEQRNDKMLSK